MMCLPAFLPWYKSPANTHTQALRAALTWLTHSWLLLWLYTVAILFHVAPLPSARRSLALIRNVTHWLGSLLQIYVAQVLSLKLHRASVSLQSYKHGLYHTRVIKVQALVAKKVQFDWKLRVGVDVPRRDCDKLLLMILDPLPKFFLDRNDQQKAIK